MTIDNEATRPNCDDDAVGWLIPAMTGWPFDEDAQPAEPVVPAELVQAAAADLARPLTARQADPNRPPGAHRRAPAHTRTPLDLKERWSESGVIVLAVTVASLLGLALFLMLVVQ